MSLFLYERHLSGILNCVDWTSPFSVKEIFVVQMLESSEFMRVGWLFPLYKNIASGLSHCFWLILV